LILNRFRRWGSNSFILLRDLWRVCISYKVWFRISSWYFRACCSLILYSLRRAWLKFVVRWICGSDFVVLFSSDNDIKVSWVDFSSENNNHIVRKILWWILHVLGQEYLCGNSVKIHFLPEEGYWPVESVCCNLEHLICCVFLVFSVEATMSSSELSTKNS